MLMLVITYKLIVSREIFNPTWCVRKRIFESYNLWRGANVWSVLQMKMPTEPKHYWRNTRLIPCVYYVVLRNCGSGLNWYLKFWSKWVGTLTLFTIWELQSLKDGLLSQYRKCRVCYTTKQSKIEWFATIFLTSHLRSSVFEWNIKISRCIAFTKFRVHNTYTMRCRRSSHTLLILRSTNMAISSC
jgi:hypothetical protein